MRLAGGEVHLLGTAGGPLGGDDLALEVVVEPGVEVTVRSVAATLALPGDGRPSHQHLLVDVGADAHVRWLPEPLVAAAGCDHRASTLVRLAAGADLVWCDRVVLGRSGERAGRLASSLRVERDGFPLLHHGLDTGLPGWDSPAVAGGARGVGLVALVGRPGRGAPPEVDEVATSRLAEDVVVATTVAADMVVLGRRTAAVLAGS